VELFQPINSINTNSRTGRLMEFITSLITRYILSRSSIHNFNSPWSLFLLDYHNIEHRQQSNFNH